MNFALMWYGAIIMCQISNLPAYGQRSLSALPCKQPNERGSRIVGGADAIRGQMPFIVSLRRRGGHFCGASVLNERWLITAGHCVCNGLDKILKPNQIEAVLGLHKISEFRTTKTNTALQIAIKNIIVHTNYDCKKTNDDIALLELADLITFNEGVKPICIANPIKDSNDTYAGDIASVSGWGWNNEDQELGVRADALQTATVRIWNNAKCQESYREQQRPHIISNTQMCANNNGIDSCWADSGGPLMSSGNVLIGIVSTGIGCARPGLPGIYTRVSEYTNWIESITYNAA